jgi:S1-C subfamily serine protease
LAESNPRLGVNKDLGKRVSNLYTDLAAKANARQFEKGTGWLYMDIFSPPANPAADANGEPELKQSSKRSKDKKDQKADNAVVIGSASAFVVHPHYLLTNFHVVDGADHLTLSERGAPDRQYEVKVIAESKQDDLALLQCDELAAPPVPLSSVLPRLASDIILLGYPQSDFFGLDLKTTRGSIAGLPNPQTTNLLLYDVVSNPGNSGGPTCDQFGRAVAVHAAGLGGWGKLGGGVPATIALEFVKQSIPDYQVLSGASSQREWADLVEDLGKSTLFVRVWQKPENIEVIDRVAGAGQPPNSGRKWFALEDPWCTICYGRGTMKCPGGCSRGSIPATRNELVVVNPGTGQSLINSVPTTAPCKTCRGSGVVPCTFCSGGIDHTVVGH